MAKVFHQHLDGFVPQLLGLFDRDFRQLIRDRSRIAAEPDIFAARFGMDAIGHKVLTITQEFELVRL